MVDNRSAESRSALMSRIGGKNTAPEMEIRRLLHALGYRFRVQRRDLPGRPDIVFPSRRKVIFVNGCFWHAHGCKIGKPPKSRIEYWGPKLEANRERDARNKTKLRGAGWKLLTIWQCQIRNLPRLQTRLFSFLGPPGNISIDLAKQTR
jgi:DNA mismatch endonuclease (patch repair protein)